MASGTTAWIYQVRHVLTLGGLVTIANLPADRTMDNVARRADSVRYRMPAASRRRVESPNRLRALSLVPEIFAKCPEQFPDDISSRRVLNRSLNLGRSPSQFAARQLGQLATDRQPFVADEERSTRAEWPGRLKFSRAVERYLHPWFRRALDPAQHRPKALRTSALRRTQASTSREP